MLDHLPDQAAGHRVVADLQDGQVLGVPAQALADVVDRDPADDHAPLALQLQPVPAAGVAVLRQARLLGEQVAVAAPGVHRHQRPVAEVLQRQQLTEAGGLAGALLGAHHRAAAVGQAGDQAQDDREPHRLAVVEGLPRHVVGVLLGRRLEAGDLGELGVPAGVLLVLRAVHPRVVGHRADQAPVDPGRGGVYEGVRRHVEAHVLHRDQRPAARVGHAEGLLVGHLLVGGPVG